MNTAIDRPVADQAPDLDTTRAEVLARVDAILPLLARNAERAEADRDLAPETFQALVDSGALRLFVPRRAGGYEAGYRTYLETTLKLAAACGSSAWMSFILNHGDWQTGHMSQAVQDAVWAEGPGAKVGVPLNPAPGWRADKVDGGYKLSGEWAYTSGSSYIQWVLVGFPLIGNDGNPIDSMIGLVSMQGVEIRDTWQVTGMAATGSHTIIIKDRYIPDEWTITLSELLAHRYRTPYRRESMYQIDAGAVFHFATLAPVLGLAKAALDLTLQRITTKPKPVTYTYYGDTTKAPATQFAMARAAWLIDTAIEQARATTDAIDAQARTAQPFPAIERARFAMRAAQAHRLCREAMDLLLDVQGAGAFALANPMQRIWRDFSIATRHGLSIPGFKQEIYGRALLGAQEQHMTPMT